MLFSFNRNKSSPEEVLQAVLSQIGIFCSVPRMDQLLNSLLEFISNITQSMYFKGKGVAAGALGLKKSSVS